MLTIARGLVIFEIKLHGVTPLSVFHGGDLAGAAQKFGVALDQWVDLSTGINPNPYPICDLDPRLWHRLPEQHYLDALKKAAATCYGVNNPQWVIPTSGTQTVLQILPRLYRDVKKVRVVGPTYKEHFHCWALAGHDVAYVSDLKCADDCDVLIVVNPNNPTGRIFSVESLLEARARLVARGGLLIVDGAFVDVMPDVDMSSQIGQDGLLVLRSFGKFYGLAGIRLGFVLAGGALGAKMSDAMGPWAVNGPALEIGRQALSDCQWQAKAASELKEAANRLDRICSKAGLEVVGGTSLFRFIETDNAAGLYEHLGRAGILVRPFDDLPRHIRLGLPGGERDWQRLEVALSAFGSE